MKLTEAMILAARQEIGRRAGKVGGKARAAALSPKRRSSIARKAARARWDKAKIGTEGREAR